MDRGGRSRPEDGPATGGDGPEQAGKGTLLARRYPALGTALRATGADGGAAPTVADAATAAIERKDGGSAVDGAVAAQVGSHLGADLSAVRVHGDPLAREATAAMGARAFAYGGDVFLGPGERGDDLGLMAHELTHVVQQGAAGQRAPQRAVQVGDAGSPAEQQADQVATAVTGGAGASRLLVDDGPVGPGQMLKSQFAEQLRPLVAAAADEELGPIYSAIGCPYIDRYFSRYATEPASAVIALLARFAPATRSATTASEMIPVVVARVRAGVRTWRDTGEPPAEIASVAPEATAAAVGAQAQALRAPDGRETLASLEADLGAGAPLDAGTASRMSAALGADVSAARLHTGPIAARKADEAAALAFAVGDHVVMGARAPAAGTLEGDALLAHELAHTVQQAGAGAAPLARMQPIGGEASAAETDADAAAEGAMVALHGEKRGLAARIGTSLRSGLRLQRCPDNNTPAPAPAAPIGANRNVDFGNYWVVPDGTGPQPGAVGEQISQTEFTRLETAFTKIRDGSGQIKIRETGDDGTAYPGFKARMVTQFGKLMSKPAGRGVVMNLVGAGHTVTIIPSAARTIGGARRGAGAVENADGTSGGGGDSVIIIEAGLTDTDIVCFDPAGNRISAPIFLILGHELIHATHNDAGHNRRGRPSGDAAYPNLEEQETIATGAGTTENTLRAEHGLGVRHGHRLLDTRP